MRVVRRNGLWIICSFLMKIFSGIYLLLDLVGLGGGIGYCVLGFIVLFHIETRW
jgi:hypothetical protein